MSALQSTIPQAHLVPHLSDVQRTGLLTQMCGTLTVLRA